MTNVKIYGAGSIGNHLAFACRGKGWDVTICDPDGAALTRTREDIYPARYGCWDEAIRLFTNDQVPADRFDLVIIGSPPDTHVELALQVLAQEQPAALLIEKPLCGPALRGCDELLAAADSADTFVAVAYNHILTDNTLYAADLIRRDGIGEPQTIAVNWVEHWGGIFGAHPWLAGPADSYLGFTARGGGAGCEHSHGVNIWQHFAHLLGAGRVSAVSALRDMVVTEETCYDRIFQAHVQTESGLLGHIVQDVVSQPAEKKLAIQGSEARLEWYANRDASHDAVSIWRGDEGTSREFEKSRPDDFKGEIDHIGDVLEGRADPADSPIALVRGLDTMLLIAAAELSAQQRGRTVTIDYSNGYSSAALQLSD